MNFTTTQLLRYHPLTALLILTNQASGLRLNIDQIRVERVEALEEGRARVTLEYFDDPAPVTRQLYTGRGTVICSRIDVEEFFGARDITLKVPYPTTTLDVLAAMQERTGIVFDLNDFEQDTAFEPSAELVAQSTSLRWVGKTTLKLEQDPDYKIDLNTLIQKNVLNGFFISDLSKLGNVLDGFYQADLDHLKQNLEGFKLPGSHQP